MSSSDKQFDKLLEKIEKLKANGTYDLSMEEDLAIAIMNLISLEEHFYFTSKKTGKDNYYDLLEQTREIRKTLLAKLIDRHEGETWCISKHLLATTMRLIEVGTKLQSQGKKVEAKDFFNSAYKTYSMFWALRLKLIGIPDLKKQTDNQGTVKLEDIISRLVDCCKE